ncbi:hypothetical protein MLD38_035931 [Melastoma candidum]|uniref:Uncharacterized protein n=1 Tax=Melastoma candidum TaxID=119954 RepID=A0ACB9LID3_9MYRT|nr:hypothetical protein MLD38_035931 [Melastoma candidum]
MSELRFLILDSAVIVGDFRGVFQKLRWLQWRRCRRDYEATDVDTKDLLILDLSGSAITEDWKGWENITLINVKVLNLSGCTDLLLTPNFTKSPELERLILEGCALLVHIDPSIGTLKQLVYLNLKSCQELNILPQELGPKSRS